MQTGLTGSSTGRPGRISADCGMIWLVGNSSQPECTLPLYPSSVREVEGIRQTIKMGKNESVEL